MEITGKVTKKEKIKITEIMFSETHCSNICSDKAWPESAWVSIGVKFPGFESTDDSVYLYQLYKIYSQSPQSVADRIIALANSLENIQE